MTDVRTQEELDLRTKKRKVEVEVGAATPSLVHDGQTFHFCCEGCRDAFARQHAA